MALLEFDEPLNRAVIKVIGVGGGGGNAVNTMIAAKLDGVEFIAANTDMQALEANMAPVKCQLGCNVTRGLGAGANPEIGRQAAVEDRDRIAEVLKGTDMIFVTAGMGGGTGTGGAPIIAEVAREMGCLTVGVVTKPFTFEGKRRRRQAEEGTQALAVAVDTLITIPNDRLLAVAGQKMSMVDAFRRVDDILVNAVSGITDLISVHGLVNVDFADVKTVMSNMGRALMGTGRAAGDNRAVEAAKQAISSPLLEDVSIDGATGILINITGGADLTLFEVNEAASLIQEAAHEDANIIFGSVIDASLKDELRITVIATGFDRGPGLGANRASQTAVNSAAAPRRPAATSSQITMSYGEGSHGVRGAPVPVVPAPSARTSVSEPVEPVVGTACEISAPMTVPRVVLEHSSRSPMSERLATPGRTGASGPSAIALEAPLPVEERLEPDNPLVTQSVDLDLDDAEDATDPTPVTVALGVSSRSRAERSGPGLSRLHSILSPQDEAEIDIPTFLRRQPNPSHHQ
jgi:cell division protein FtsZ